jgi:hypothetical protein
MMSLDLDADFAPPPPKDQDTSTQVGKKTASGEDQQPLAQESVDAQGETGCAAKLAHNMAQWNEAEPLSGTPGPEG